MFKFIKFFRPYYRKYKLDTVMTVLFQTLQKITILLIPLATKRLLDLAGQQNNMSEFTQYGFISFALSLSFILFLSLRYFYQSKLETKVTNDLKQAIVSKSLSISYSDFLKKDPGFFVQRINKDAERVTGLIISDISMLVINVVYAAAIIVMMFSINPTVSIILLLMFPLFFWVSRYFTPRIQKVNEAVMEQEEQLNTQVNEQINGNYFIRTSNKEEHFDTKSKSKFKDIYKSVLRKIKLEIVYDFFLVTGIMNLSNVLIYWLGGYFVFTDVMTFGSLTALSLYFSRLWSPIEFFMAFPKKIKAQGISLNRIKTLLDEKDAETGNTQALPEKFEKISVENLTFSLGDKLLFDNLSLDIQKGERIGILGGNGTGKTTLMNLLIKIFSDYSGRISFNDMDYTKINAHELREKIILVPQELYVFSDFYSEENVKNTNRSGGEKKMLQIRESLDKNGELYLFDEPLAYVDTDRKREFLAFMEEEFADKSFLIISHDAEVFKLCDTLYRIQDNKLIRVEGL